jgi:F-box/WD-40 domain protein 7
MFNNFSSKSKLQALEHLLELCDHTQIKHVHNYIEPKLQRDYMSELPKELVFNIVEYLRPRDLYKLAQVSHYWYQISNDKILWKNMCKKYSIKKEEDAEETLDETRTHEILDLKEPYSFLYTKFNAFKRSYIIDYNLCKNWCTRPLPLPLQLRSHDDHVITCLKFDGRRIISGSDDNTLKVWCSKSGKLLHTLHGHTGGVWASQLHGSICCSGSTDRTVRVWNIDTGECLHTLVGHTSTVRCLALHESKICISGSRDSLLRVWNIETGECLQILKGHQAAVRCVCFDGKLCISGSYDFKIRVWNPFSGECLHILEGHTNRVYSLLFDGQRIVSGSLDTTIIVWNVQTGKIVHRLIGHNSLTSGMQIKQDLLVSGNADSTIKIWSLKTGKFIIYSNKIS